LNLREILFLWHLKRRLPVLKALVVGGKWANLLVLVAQILNDATNTIPSLANNHWLLMVQGILAAILPSVSKTVTQIAHPELAEK
jgi:hypothetical protein